MSTTPSILTHEMLPKPGYEHYLCIDLDGTLVLTDTFGEAVLRFLRHFPLRLPHLLIWFLRGRAFLKMKVCEATPLAPENLPYNSALIDYIKDKKANGSMIVLATGAHQSFAAQVAEHLDIFDEVLSSDGRQNLVGANKARLLAAKYPGFQYAGNSRADLPVWKQSGGAILVSDSAGLKRLLQRSSIPIIRVISTKRGGPVTWMRAIRVSTHSVDCRCCLSEALRQLMAKPLLSGSHESVCDGSQRCPASRDSTRPSGHHVFRD